MQSKKNTKYFTKVEQLEQLNEQEKVELKKVTDKFAFCANDYYLSLIDWNDPNGPIRRIVIPSIEELEEWGKLDPSDEKAYTIFPGLEHKYHSVVVFLVTYKCDSLCRYCFRKRLFIESEREYLQDWDAAYQYVREHTEITNVLLTGGDALMLPTSQLEEIFATLREIKHVRIIRLGTRIPSYNPYRITDDPALLSRNAKRFIGSDFYMKQVKSL
jgi:KamA family protein